MQSITPQDAYHAINDQSAVLIDVRETSEYDEAHIKGAILVPLSTLPAMAQDVDFDSMRGKKIIFQCLKGGRSAQAIEFLQDGLIKDHDVYNLEGGILAWAEADLPVITP